MPELNVQNYISGSDYLTILVAVLLRWCISLHSYSGEKKPPMFGDYEAQRHWMEITYNLKIQDWYRNTSDNDLNYWGLDYPPLTAYHSYICGFFASLLVPESVKLQLSRGHESYEHKLFMRYSVLIPDLLLYFPAVYWYFKISKKQKDLFSSNLCTFFTLMYPGLILIDYGHFQYNCVSLGFFILAVFFITTQYFKTAALFFCLAVNYKQMELYHSLPFFFFFLGNFFLYVRKGKLLTALKFIVPLGMVVLITFFIIWFPFLSSVVDTRQVLHRIFPVARGVFEDKVSTFWCILNVVHKVHLNVDNEIMFKICFLVTLLSVLPSVLDLLLHPTIEKFKLSLIINSICFYLFSYHVHEKSILLAAVPVALDFIRHSLLSYWFLSITTFSMLPLLIKDGLFIPYFVLFLFYFLCYQIFLNKRDIYFLSIMNQRLKIRLKTVIDLSLLGCILLSLVAKFCTPPQQYPHFWPLLISCYSFFHFVGFLSYYYLQQCNSWFIKKKRN